MKLRCSFVQAFKGIHPENGNTAAFDSPILQEDLSLPTDYAFD